MHQCQHVVSDMTTATPQGALSAGYCPGRWLLIPYETDEFAGTMALLPARNAAPNLTIPLGVSGWHRIHVGTYPDEGLTLISNGRMPFNYLRLRLTGERRFHAIESEEALSRKDKTHPSKTQYRRSMMTEAFWRCADLTGQDLEVGASTMETLWETTHSLAYVRLVPMTKAEVEKHKQDIARTDTRRLIGVYSGTWVHSYFRGVESMDEWFAPFGGTDFRILMLGTAWGDACYYPSSVGGMLPDDEMPGLWPHTMGRDLHRMVRSGVDPLERMVALSHESGLEVYASLRLISARIPPGDRLGRDSAFFSKHPECWALDPEGNRTPHVSLAHPETRSFFVRLFREQAEDYDIDGIHVVYCRGYPFVLYEPASDVPFQKEYGCDPRTLPFTDPRWMEHAAGFVTTFMQELRAMLDDVGTRKGKRLGLAAHVMNSVANCRVFGLDIVRWAREGLVDHVITHNCNAWAVRPEPGMLDPYLCRGVVDALSGTGVAVQADMYPRHIAAQHLITQAEEYYAAGLDGLSFWDVNLRIHRKSEWAVMAKLGHRNELGELKPWADSLYRAVGTSMIAGYSNKDAWGFSSG